MSSEKAMLTETTNIHDQRIWIVRFRSQMKESAVFYKKSEAKKYKDELDLAMRRIKK